MIRREHLPFLALSVRQPWAWALFNGKPVENRSRTAVAHMHAKMRPGGYLLIHAAKGMTQNEYAWSRQTIDNILGEGACPRPDALVRSALIGVVAYVECIKRSTSPWFFGPYGMVFQRQNLFPEPIPCGGDLGFFPWNQGRYSLDAIDQPKPWMTKWRSEGYAAGLKPAFIHSDEGGSLL